MDKYTKAVLTVIAICLVLLVGKGVAVTPLAHASSGAFALSMGGDKTAYWFNGHRLYLCVAYTCKEARIKD